MNGLISYGIQLAALAGILILCCMPVGLAMDYIGDTRYTSLVDLVIIGLTGVALCSTLGLWIVCATISAIT